MSSSHADLTVTINGEARAVPSGITFAALLDLVGVTAARVAVERNLDVVPRATWGAARVEDGDQIEIVTFVGGG